MDAMEKMDDLDDGSIPDLTEVCVVPDNPMIEKDCCKHKATKDSNEIDCSVILGNTSGNRMKESRQKLQNTYGKFHNGIKVAMNKTTCFDDTDDTGRHKK